MFRSVLKALSQRKIALLAGIVAIGIIFILAGEYTSKGKAALDPAFDESSYTSTLEKRLEEIISRVDGVSDARVMVTLAGSATYRYGADQASSLMTSVDPASSSLSYDIGRDHAADAVPVGISAPEIKGVSVVCKGAGSPALRQKVIGLIAGALNLSANRIYVTE
ncbi:MAG: hypothetical protein J6Z79_07495 [Clostridia bacterium]|nr:hypothetical protein [Clostridia bacterium]